eukprot:gene3834-2714_t
MCDMNGDAVTDWSKKEFAPSEEALKLHPADAALQRSAPARLGQDDLLLKLNQVRYKAWMKRCIAYGYPPSIARMNSIGMAWLSPTEKTSSDPTDLSFCDLLKECVEEGLWLNLMDKATWSMTLKQVAAKYPKFGSQRVCGRGRHCCGESNVKLVEGVAKPQDGQGQGLGFDAQEPQHGKPRTTSAFSIKAARSADVIGENSYCETPGNINNLTGDGGGVDVRRGPDATFCARLPFTYKPCQQAVLLYTSDHHARHPPAARLHEDLADARGRRVRLAVQGSDSRRLWATATTGSWRRFPVYRDEPLRSPRISARRRFFRVVVFGLFESLRRWRSLLKCMWVGVKGFPFFYLYTSLYIDIYIRYFFGPQILSILLDNQSILVFIWRAERIVVVGLLSLVLCSFRRCWMLLLAHKTRLYRLNVNLMVHQATIFIASSSGARGKSGSADKSFSFSLPFSTVGLRACGACAAIIGDPPSSPTLSFSPSVSSSSSSSSSSSALLAPLRHRFYKPLVNQGINLWRSRMGRVHKGWNTWEYQHKKPDPRPYPEPAVNNYYGRSRIWNPVAGKIGLVHRKSEEWGWPHQRPPPAGLRHSQEYFPHFFERYFPDAEVTLLLDSVLNQETTRPVFQVPQNMSRQEISNYLRNIYGIDNVNEVGTIKNLPDFKIAVVELDVPVSVEFKQIKGSEDTPDNKPQAQEQQQLT